MSPYAPGLRADARSASCNQKPAGTATIVTADKRSANISETAKLLLAGGVAGALSKSATAPLARLTILYQVKGLQYSTGQVQKLGLRQAFQQVICQEGVRALWKGNGVTMLHRLPYSAVNFWAYEQFTQQWQLSFPSASNHSQDAVLRRLLAGGAAGMCACTLAYPLDLVRTRLAAQTTTHYYKGIWHALSTIVKDEGLFGLYRGLGATLTQVAPSLAMNYCAYETLRSYWMSHEPARQSPTVTMSLASGSIAGLVSSTATFPLDLIRRRMQLQGQGGCQVQYTSYSHAFRTVIQREGFVGLYHGILPEYYKVVPGVAIAFCTYELMKSMLGVQTNVVNR
ncbi:hypothetical protein ABBQ32_005946 [Trebouxia sp. C0010 RCD-2024]